MRASQQSALHDEDGRFTERLLEACCELPDPDRGLVDPAVKFQVLWEVHEEVQVKLELAHLRAEEVLEEAAMLRGQLAESRAKVEGMQARGAQHWAEMKALEAQRDKALVDLAAARERAAAAALRASVGDAQGKG